MNKASGGSTKNPMKKSVSVAPLLMSFAMYKNYGIFFCCLLMALCPPDSSLTPDLEQNK